MIVKFMEKIRSSLNQKRSDATVDETNPRVHYIISWSKQDGEYIESMGESIGAENLTEVLNKSISALEFLINLKEQNCDLYITVGGITKTVDIEELIKGL